jgi:hypothetical protein
MFYGQNLYGDLINVLSNEELSILAKDLEVFKDKITTTKIVYIKHDELTPVQIVDALLQKIQQQIDYNTRQKLINEAVKNGTTTIPESDWGVHETHCCKDLGCKYGADDCPVVMSLIKQRYRCEFCEGDCSFKKEEK